MRTYFVDNNRRQNRNESNNKRKTILERETTERNRQSGLMRQYFDSKRAAFDARQEKFLRIYPYLGASRRADFRRFESSVRMASDIQRAAIMQAYEAERHYWNSPYVMDHCNCSVYIHIINTLDGMENILNNLGCGCSSVQSGAITMTFNVQDDQNSSNNEQVKRSIDGNNWGKVGEDAVDYVLKWLPDMYCVIEKDCVGKYSDNIILLENPSFSDETQEFDHLVIGPQGIFNIETKNYSGKLSIDKAGNWLRLKKGETEWIAEENPAQQVFRHRVLLQSIVGYQVPVIDVICLSHPSILIAGQENSRVPVIKKDLLADFIVNYPPVGITPNQAARIKNKINSCKTNK